MSFKTDLRYILANVMNEHGLKVEFDEIKIERPLLREHGDFSTNIAMVFAKKLSKSPRELAAELIADIKSKVGANSASDYLGDIEKIEIAGPGFINFYVGNGWLIKVLIEVLEDGFNSFRRTDFGKGESIQIEFVSANPTGPLHVGNGWWASYGDSLSRLLTRAGYKVEKEYYVNDTGGQIRNLGKSVIARKNGELPPDDGYQGEYVSELARKYIGSDDVVEAGRWAADEILLDIKETLLKLGVAFDSWYSQASIEEGGAVKETIEELKMRDVIYEHEGALWLKSESLGDSRDRVLVKSNGDVTYTGGDIAYHRDKFITRGFDRVIDIFGADHHGQVATLKASMEVLGIEPNRLEIKLGQMVSLVGSKMSKRSGNFVRLSTLIDDIGVDATRLLSLMNSIDQATTLDIDLVKSTSMENPVYYVQYAYARISSILRRASDAGVNINELSTQNITLNHLKELEMLRIIDELEDVLEDAVKSRTPSKVTTYVRSLAGAFHSFYHDCPVLNDNEEIQRSRLALVVGVKTVFEITLNLLGVSMPEKM